MTQFKCWRKDLAGQTVTKNGQTVRYDAHGFPEFPSKFDAQIPDADLINKPTEHFKMALLHSGFAI